MFSKLLPFIITVLLATSVFAGDHTSDVEKAQALSRISQQKYINGEVGEAISLLEKAIVFDAKFFRYSVLLAKYYEKNGQHQQALAHIYTMRIVFKSSKEQRGIESLLSGFIASLHKKAVAAKNSQDLKKAEELFSEVRTYIEHLSEADRLQVEERLSSKWDGWGTEIYDLGDYDHGLRYYVTYFKHNSLDRKLQAANRFVDSLKRRYKVQTLVEQRALFLSLLKDQNAVVRHAAAMALAEVGNRHTVPALIDALPDASDSLQFAILFSLKKIGSPAVGSVIKTYLHSEFNHYRKFALRMVIELRVKSLLSEVLPLLADEDSDISQKAAKAVAVIGDKGAVPALLAQLGQPEAPEYEILSAIRMINDSTVQDEIFKYVVDHLLTYPDSNTSYGKMRQLISYSGNTMVLTHGVLVDSPGQYLESITQEGAAPPGIRFLADCGDPQHYLDIVTNSTSTPAEHAAALLVFGNMNGINHLEVFKRAAEDVQPLVQDAALTVLYSLRELSSLKSTEAQTKRLHLEIQELEALDQPTLQQQGELEIRRVLGFVLVNGNDFEQKFTNQFSVENYNQTLEQFLQSDHSDEDLTEKLSTAFFYLPYGALSDGAHVQIQPLLEHNNMWVRDWATLLLAASGDTVGLTRLGTLYLDPESWISTSKVDRIIAVQTLARFQQYQPIYKCFAQNSSITDFNILRTNFYLNDDIQQLISTETPFVKSAGYYLESLRAREIGDFNQQYASANLSLKQIDPIEYTPTYLLALWQKAQAELKLNRADDALATMIIAEGTLQHLMRQEYQEYEELFEEYTSYLKGEALLATGHGRKAIESFQYSLNSLDEYRHEPLYAQVIQRLEKLLNNSLGIAMRRVGTEHLENARIMAQESGANDSWELDNEERGKLELARNYIGEGRADKAQEIFEEITLSRQKFANRRLKVTFADPVKQQQLEMYRSRQQEIDTLTQQITDESRQAFEGKEKRESLLDLERLKRKKQKELRRYITKLKRSHPDLALLMGTEPLELKSLQEKLPDDVAIVQYLLLPDLLAAFVITAYDIEIIESPINRDDLKQKVEAYREALTSRKSVAIVTELGRVLYDILIKPIDQAGVVEDYTTLGIAPSGFLHYLPFAALVDGEGHYFLERYKLFGVNSTSILWVAMDRGEQSTDSRTLLALGNPDGTLPAAGREVAAIGALYPGSKVYHDQTATITTLREQIPTSGLIHLSTHGILNPRDSSQSYLVMADGNLSIEDIWGLPLNGASLTTLSACDTGIGEILSGDDIISMENAFIYAGSPSVISTLWPVADDSTAKLMELFYGNLSSGKSRAESLRNAQLSLLRGEQSVAGGDVSRGSLLLMVPVDAAQSSPAISWSHPYFWSAFTLRGDWR